MQMYMKFILEEPKHFKVVYVLLNMFIFSIVYMFISDDEWFGVNKIKDIVKDEATRDKIDEDKNIIEGAKIYEGYSNFSEFFVNEVKTDVIAEIDKVEKDVENQFKQKTIEKTLMEMYFNRLYFSIVTGCLLGYGDIYPESMRLKALVSVQALLTIIIIVL